MVKIIASAPNRPKRRANVIQQKSGLRRAPKPDSLRDVGWALTLTLIEWKRTGRIAA